MNAFASMTVIVRYLFLSSDNARPPSIHVMITLIALVRLTAVDCHGSTQFERIDSYVFWFGCLGACVSGQRLCSRCVFLRRRVHVSL